MIVEPEDWRLDGVCRTTNPELFFSDNWRDMEKAKDICNTQCSVKRQCLAEAMSREDEQGVWGGTSRPDRTRLRNLA